MASPEHRWDERLFLEDVDRRMEADAARAIRHVIASARANGARIEWKDEWNESQGKANFIFAAIGSKPLFSLYSLGAIEVRRGTQKDSQALRRAKDELRKQLQGKGLELLDDEINLHFWLPKVLDFESAVHAAVGGGKRSTPRE